MSAIILDCALELALQKVRLFACRPNSKLPAVDRFSEKATCDPEKLTALFGSTSYNSGIACGKISEGLYLVGFDIDDKDGRRGYDTIGVLAECGLEFPPTWSQRTPSGGEHRLFWSPVPIRQGTNVLGSGVDLRGDGGYLVGPGSVLGGRLYTVLTHLPIAAFPRWAVEKYEKKATIHQLKPAGGATPVANQVLALSQSVEYLQAQEPSGEGSRSNDCFKHAARMKDFGLAQSQVMEVLHAHWRCEPMLTDDELIFTINNAYHYSKNSAGVAAPENIFSPIGEDETPLPPTGDPGPLDENPIDLLNRDHFYYAANGISRVCWETKAAGKFHLERFPVYTFHEKHLAKKMLHNGKTADVTRVWLESEKRRTYDRLRFDPSHSLQPNEYNLWRGFNVEPIEDGAAVDPRGEAAAQMFFEHCHSNICGSDDKLFKWLLTFLAHIFQHPGEKPRASLVFKGKKGTGKTIVSEILGHLIGTHAVIIANRSHVLGHFNSIMEDKLLVTLDEAFWSGDKQVEGTLKDIITGNSRVITHKGAEPYPAKVFDRIIIISNEDWVVPASADERRFAVFEIGEGRRGDNKFFGTLKDGLFKHGGDRILLRRLLDWAPGENDVNIAPETEGLRSQKDLSLSVFHQWWLNCLQDAQILGSGLSEWPDEISVNDFYSAFTLQLQAENVRGYKPSKIHVGKMFRTTAPRCGVSHVGTGNVRRYALLPIDLARAEWDEYRGFQTRWDS
jgi:hypothetical protein